MRKIPLLTMLGLALLFSVFFQDVSEAQRRGGFGFGQQPNLMSTLLGMEEVRKELGLNDEQGEKAAELAQKIGAALREEMADLRDADDEERVEIMAEIETELKQEEMETIKELLDEDQLKRLRQLLIQRMGIQRALVDEQIAKTLNITDEQREKIKSEIQANSEAMQEKMAEARESGDFQAMRGVMTELGEELEKTLMGVLNKEQKEQLAEMKGKEFEFPQRQRRGRRDF